MLRGRKLMQFFFFFNPHCSTFSLSKYWQTTVPLQLFFFYKHLPCQIPWKPHESPPRCQCPSFSWPSWSKTLGSRWFHFLQIEIAITINTGLAQFCFLPSFLQHFSDVSSYLIYLGCLIERHLVRLVWTLIQEKTAPGGYFWYAHWRLSWLLATRP